MKACSIIIKGPLQGPNLLFLDTYLQEVVTSQLYVVFCVLPVLGKLICCPREFYYLILVVCVSINKNNKMWHKLVLHVVVFGILNVFVNYFEFCRK